MTLTRTIALAVTAAAAIGATNARADDSGAPSFPMLSGNLAVYAGFGDYSDCGNCEFSILGGTGGATLWFNPSWGLQVDAILDSWHRENDGSWNGLGIVGHAFYGNGTSYRVGGYLGSLDFGFQDRLLTGGVEAQGYFGQFTVEGRFGGYWTSGGGDLYTAYAAVRYFPNDNLKLEVSAFHDWLSWSDESATGIGARVEYKLATQPISLFAQVDHAWWDDDFDPFDYSLTTASVGVKFLFRERTLRGEDMTGTSFGQGLLMPVRIVD